MDANLLPGDDFARIGLTGPEGSGKTLTALKIARGIVGPKGRIAVIDTENRSSRKFRAYERFAVQPLDNNFAPAKYVEFIHDAEKEGFDALIIDSLTHAWNAPGGVLDMVDSITGGNKKKNLNAWAKASPEHNRLVQALIHSKLNLLCTLRVKTAMEEVELPDGSRKFKKVGLMPVQRDGMMYEFDIVVDFDVDDHSMNVVKSRIPQLDKQVLFKKRDRSLTVMGQLEKNLQEAEWFGIQVNEWLSTGVGKSRLEMVIESIRVKALGLGQMDEVVEGMIEAAGSDIAVLDQILLDLGD